MSKNVLIVESPAKAKTIEKYLGADFTVKASYGHVRDLPKDDKAIDIENGFEPKYIVIDDKKSVIKELKQLIKGADKVWLATDEDREGEAISWHLANVLGLDLATTPRIVFNEITKKAVQAAIANPRFIDENLVNAQQARRILDRIVGFKLSPVLWKKIKTGLSAGRVQSVAVRIVVEREKEIMAFLASSDFRVSADFLLDSGARLEAKLGSRPQDKQAAEDFLNSCKGASYTISKLETRPGKKSPAAPFTTSTLQQEASRKLGFSVSRTMVVAQRLYESGHITYMRTDSVNLSQTALDEAGDVINLLYGKDFHKARQYKNKNASAQEAHEAIRPTDLSVSSLSEERDQERLYELIWKRTIASQMEDARLEKTTVDISLSTNDAIFKASGEVLTFEGFLKVYLEGQDDEEEEQENPEGVLPPMEVGQVLDLKEMVALERFSRPAPRYTEASLVKKLEELGIGRPSTYAPTISTIQKRNYAIKDARDGEERSCQMLILKKDKVAVTEKTEITGADKNKLFPTDLGMVVSDFLVKFFPDILDYSFTRQVEEEFDHIAQGTKEWHEMLSEFYSKFAPLVEDTINNAEREGGERELGVHPENGKPVIARLGRFGPMVQIGGRDDEEKPQYAKLRSDQRLSTITMEEALELFKLPRVLGEYEEQAVKASIGRFGPYVQIGKLFVSLKEDDPYEIELPRAIELIEAKREADRNKIIKVYNDDVSILNGRWGPYIKYGKENVKIPKDVKEPANLTMEDIEKLHEEHLKKPKRGKSRKK